MKGRALADALLARLWTRYRARVPHVRTYERVLKERGARFENDHIAFRTLAWQDPGLGIQTVGRVFEALGWRAAACYFFPDKRLNSIHYAPPEPGLPKVFVSELRTWELSPRARALIARSMRRHRAPLPDGALAAPSAAALDRFFKERPWPAPAAADLLALERESQFGAWVLAHGYEVNHFTASVNAHGVAALGDIEKTVAALRAAGVPMKAEIEGARETKLRQSATEAAKVEVAVAGGGKLPWTYAYFEIAERGEVVDPETGRKARFEGFLGPQASQLFEMTRR